MMAPTFIDWGKWIAMLAILGVMLPALAFLIAAKCRNAQGQLSIWRSAFVLLLVLSLGETSGFFQGLGEWLRQGETSRARWSVSHSSSAPLPSDGRIDVEATPLVETPVGQKPAPWYERRSWVPGIVLFGGMGLGILGGVVLRLILGYYLSRHQLPVGERAQECFRLAMQRLGYSGRCRLSLSSGKLGPLAFGVIRPTVVIPSLMIEAFSDDELSLVYAHELAHLKNRDPWWHPLAAVVTLMFWWHPMVWWARRNLLISGEFAADSRAVNADYSPVSLAECLVKFGRRISGGNRLSLLFQNGAAFESALGRRVERLVKGRPEEKESTAVKRFGVSTGSGVAMISVYLVVSRIGFPGVADGNLVAGVFGADENSAEVSESVAPDGDAENASETEDPVELPVPFVGDLPVLNGDQTETVDPVAASESPAETEAPEEVTKSAAKPSSEKPMSSDSMVTRRFRVNPEQIRKALDEFEDSDLGTQSKVNALVRRVAPSIAEPSGDEADPTKGFALYNMENNMMLVRVLASEMVAVEELMSFLLESPEQVVLEFDIVELDDDANRVLSEYLPGFAGLEEAVTERLPHAILKESAFDELTDALIRQAGCDVLSAPHITTISGRSAELTATESRSIVFPRDFEESPEGTSLFSEGTPTGTLDPEETILTREVRIGPTTSVLPTVRRTDEGFEIDLDVAFLLREFLGYDDPGPFTMIGAEESQQETIPLPRFRHSEAKTRATILNGQTLALKGMSSTSVRKVKSKVPVLGSLPILGGLFRSERTETIASHLVIFVTAIVVDPAGNRIEAR